MPIDYSLYHPKWSLISRLVRKRRAKNRCEWCHTRNGLVVRKVDRKPPGNEEWASFKDLLRRDYSRPQAMRIMGWTKVVLTVAHIDQDRNNNRFSNLAALCQKCHLNHDRVRHMENRKYGRKWREIQLAIEF